MRFLFRANHVYILFSGLLNLSAGVAFPAWRPRLAVGLQRIGSVLLLLAPAVLMAAFTMETTAVTPRRPLTALGALLCFAGVALHLGAALADRRRGDTSIDPRS